MPPRALKTERHTTSRRNAQKEWHQHVINGKGRRNHGSEEGKSRSWLCCPSAIPDLKNSPLETFSPSKKIANGQQLLWLYHIG